MAVSSSKLFAVVHLSYDFNDVWLEVKHFVGTYTECLDWVFSNCSSDFSSGIADFWYGSQRVEIVSCEGEVM